MIQIEMGKIAVAVSPGRYFVVSRYVVRTFRCSRKILYTLNFKFTLKYLCIIILHMFMIMLILLIQYGCINRTFFKAQTHARINYYNIIKTIYDIFTTQKRKKLKQMLQ